METYDTLLASITPESGETRTIFDPATGEPVGEAPVHTVEDLEQAIAAAQAGCAAVAVSMAVSRSSTVWTGASPTGVPVAGSRMVRVPPESGVIEASRAS